jgi:hypothetical protein
MSTATKLERRKLSFATLDDVVLDAQNLQTKGYEKTGNWDLAQICLHLADWMRFPIEGFPKPPLPIRFMLWGLRNTIGRKMYRKYTLEGMPAGKPTMPQSVHQPGPDAASAIAKLKEAVERFKAYTGTIHPSPLFGALNKDEATRLQLVHCAHHLSFLVPKT